MTVNIPVADTTPPSVKDTAKAYDAAGNVKTSSAVSLTVNIPVADTTPPSVSITSPVSGSTYTTAQTRTINASASDNVGVTTVRFYDGSTLKSTDNTSPYSYNWAFTSANNGAHSWTAKAYDAAGHVKTSSAVSLIVNIGNPFNFSLSNSGNKSVTQGSSDTNVILANLVSSTSQAVSFSVSGLP